MQDFTMRADNDHAVGNSVESCKGESKPHQCVEEEWEEDDAELKMAENGKNVNNSCELFYDTRGGDEWEKESGLERNSRGDPNEAVGKETRDDDSVEKVDPVFYMDKNVTACDLPEIVVCYKENTYHVVKDICVDEGVPVQEKFLFGEKDSVQSSSEDSVNVNPLGETKSSVDDDDSEKTNRDAEESSSTEEFADAQGSSNFNQESLIEDSSPKLGWNPFLEIESDENPKDEVATSENSLALGDILSREDVERPLNDENSEKPEEQSLNSQLEVEEKTEENLCSVSKTTTSQEANKEPEKPETENQQRSCLVEEDKLLVSGFGETSFSAAEAVSVSGHITYSGPVAYSGSLSVRSDASTTSGRSFAFPILQSEWNSSPVRMAKADKRRHKGWRDCLLCCRFS